MATELQQSTAASVAFGPFLDGTNASTPETALAIDASAIYVAKNGAAFASMNSSTSPEHDAAGWYPVELDATDTGTLGELVVQAHISGALPVWREFSVVTANWWDTKYSTDQLDVNVTNVAGTSQTGNDNGADINDILLDTAEIGASGGGLTLLGGISTSMMAEIQKEVNDALIANNLDHLALTVTATADMTTEVADNTILSRILANGDTSAFVPSTDGLQLIRDKQTDIETDTEEIGASGGGLTLLGGISTSMMAEIQKETNDALIANNLDHLALTVTAGTDMTNELADNTILSRILANGDTSAFVPSTDGLQLIRDKLTDIETDTEEIGASGGGLTLLGGISTSMMAEIQSEVNDALVVLKLDHLVAVADSDDVVNNAIIAKLTSKSATADWSTFVNTTDSLEAARDKLTDIETDTEEIGASGGGLTLLGGISTSMMAEIQLEVNDALVVNNLDHLALTTTAAADMTTEVSDGTILSRILANGDTSAFVPSTDGLQLIRDKLTDIETDTAEIGASGGGLTLLGGISTSMMAEVQSEVVDALNVDTYAEPGQGAPGATITLAAKIGYLYKAFRNKLTSTATTITIYADDGTTADQASTQSDDSTTYTRGEFGTGA